MPTPDRSLLSKHKIVLLLNTQHVATRRWRSSLTRILMSALTSWNTYCGQSLPVKMHFIAQYRTQFSGEPGGHWPVAALVLEIHSECRTRGNNAPSAVQQGTPTTCRSILLQTNLRLLIM